MKWYLKLTVMLGISAILVIVLLTPVLALVEVEEAEQGRVTQSELVSDGVQSSLMITTTSVATIFLPAVFQAVVSSDPQTSTSDIRITTILYDPPTNSEDEYVDLQNFGSDTVDMTGWLLHDERPFTYTFPSFTLAAGGTVRVWVITGTDTATELFWGRNTATFNNTGDSATLRDNNSDLIYTCTYTSSSTSPFTDC